MKLRFTIIFILISFNTFGQNTSKKTAPIIKEAKRLYDVEMASWYGTDIFIEKYPNKENIGGYFSYVDKNVPTCIFFNRDESPKIIGTITFDSTYNVQTASVNLEERNLNTIEGELYMLRKKAIELAQKDTIFKSYKNTALNFIPLINGKDKKVYILTGPQKSGVVIFGNDYLITFDKKNNIKSRKQLHRNIIPIYYGAEEEKDEQTMHTHSPETGDFITATDICTLMLYAKYTKWKQHTVISKKYMNIWNCSSNELFVMTVEAMKKINEHQAKQKEQNR